MGRSPALLQRCIDRFGNRGGGGGGTTTPTLTGLKIAPTSFRAAKSGATVVTGAAPAKVTFTLSVAAQRVGFQVKRPITGRRVGGRCVAPTKGNKGKPKCARGLGVVGSFGVPGVAGANSVGFTGRLANRALSPGSYRLVPIAIDRTRLTQAGVTFVIKKPATTPTR